MSRLPAGYFPVVPQMQVRITMPDMLENTAALRRIHNRVMRRALFGAMQMHHGRHIPDHFNRWRQAKYNYSPRHHTTLERKRQRHRDMADLVRTGRTKRSMQQRMTIRVSGVASTGRMRCTGVLRWKRGFRVSNAAQRGVTHHVMIREIQRWTQREIDEFSEHFRTVAVVLYNQELATRPRIHRRIGHRLQELLT